MNPTTFVHTTPAGDTMIADLIRNRLIIAWFNGKTDAADMDHETLVNMTATWTPIAWA